MTTSRAMFARKPVIAGAIGNFIEWFDYSIYGFMAVTISHVFFPKADPTAALLATFGVFALPVITRPLGGIVFARFGDRIGRKRVLAVVLLMMSLSTGVIGLIPGYASIGVAAPVLLVVARILQGFSAGGEYAGGAALIAESVPAPRRGLLVSLMPASTGLGLLTGSVFSAILTASITPTQLESWGWRVGFLLALPMGLIGLYIRLRLEETSSFRELAEQEQLSASPLRETLSAQVRNVLKVTGTSLVQTVAYYVVLVYTPTYLQTELGFSKTTSLVFSSLTIAVYVAVIPVSGHLSDRVGRRPVLFTGAIALLLAVFPTFLVFEGGNPLAIAVMQVLTGGVALGCYTGPMVSMWTELFPTQVRYTGVSLGFNLSVIASVSSPFLLTWLISTTGVDVMPAVYVAVAAAITLGTLLVLPETAPGRAAHNHLQPAVDPVPPLSPGREEITPRP